MRKLRSAAMKKSLWSCFYIILISSGIIFTYRNLYQTFFQQDEWLAFGNLIYSLGRGGIAKVIKDSLLTNASVHMVPLTQLILLTQFTLFGLNFTPYAVVSMLGQVLIAILFFYLCKAILKNSLLAFLSALLFGVSSISSQSVTWIAASIPTQPAAMFFVISLIFILKFFQTRKGRFLFFTYLALLIGLFFKESIFFLFFFIPILAFLYKKEDKKLLRQVFLSSGAILVLYSLIRVIPFIYYIQHPANSSIISSSVAFSSYVFKIILLPFRVISQSVVPIQFLLSLSRFLVSLFVGGETMAEGVGLDIICILLSLFILFIAWKAYTYFRERNEKSFSYAILVAVLLIVLSSLPLTLIPGHAGLSSIIEPRDLYIPIMGSAILFPLLLLFVSKVLLKKENTQIILVSFVVVLLLLVHYKIIRKEMNNLHWASLVRKSMLSTILGGYPRINGKAVFYFESDKAYYGLAPQDTIIPFQSGPGETLLVEYKERGQNIPLCFFEDQRFYDLAYQGYKECKGRGFGYFRSMSALKKAYKKDNFPASSVIAFRFRSGNNSLTDITDEVRKSLSSL